MNFCVRSSKGIKFSIKMKRSNFIWNNDKITMFQIGKFEANTETYIVDAIPDYLINALDERNRRNAAIKAIADFLAGWSFRNER